MLEPYDIAGSGRIPVLLANLYAEKRIGEKFEKVVKALIEGYKGYGRT